MNTDLKFGSRPPSHLDNIQSLPGADVPVAALLDLGEEPGLDERAARQHDARHARGILARVVVLVVEDVPVAEHWYRHGLTTLA